jgi:hypothetical protein
LTGGHTQGLPMSLRPWLLLLLLLLLLLRRLPRLPWFLL